MSTKIIHVKSLDADVEWFYTSVAAMLADQSNPIEMSDRNWRYHVERKGYPFEHSGCRIQKAYAKSTGDV